ncbi:MAG: hypothetical protein M0R38_11005 [Bacteroidia bacterium]|nr:hypothetical protein [Bacteroidia bacterium]
MIEDIKKRTLDDVRAAYEKYLNRQNLSPNTIATSLTNAFYIWRKQGADSFWDVVFSDNFETLSKDALLHILRQQSNGNAEANIANYIAHLRRFRRFLESESVIEVTETELVLPPPSVEQVEMYLANWQDLEDYRLQEGALNLLFLELSPNNDNISDILLKVSVLNDFYSTNIFKVFPVAKHILSLNIDERLSNEDLTLVDDIKRVDMGDRVLNFYSFASKYCSHHKPRSYPIYDSYVDKVLRYYRRVDNFADFNNENLKDYTHFNSILEDFRSFYRLDNYNLKELDKYIWQLGKEYFGRNN